MFYLNLDSFDKTAIIEVINIYKNRLEDREELKFSFLDKLKFKILAFVVPVNGHIEEIAKIMTSTITTAAYADEN